MTLAWVAERLHMGAPSPVACPLYGSKENPAGEPTTENTLFWP
jgi:hypothetical protein